MLLKAYQTILEEDHLEKVTLKVWSLGNPQQKKIVAWQSIFFLKMVDTNLMDKYQKKKKNRSSGEIEIFAHFSDFCFQK